MADKDRRFPTWAYVVAGVLGSLLGAVLDLMVYAEGGSVFLKIGIVAGPVALYGLQRLREARNG